MRTMQPDKIAIDSAVGAGCSAVAVPVANRWWLFSLGRTMRAISIFLVVLIFAGCVGSQKVRTSRLEPAAAIELASHLQAGIREEDATAFLEQHGLKAGLKFGDSFRWSQFFPLAEHCSLGLDFKPKVFRTDGVWADGLLRAAYIQSNLVNIVSITLTNAP